MKCQRVLIGLQALCLVLLGDRLYAIGPLSVLSCLSVTSVYCGRTVGWIKMKLGTHIGLPRRGTPPIFGPYLLWPNGWMDQDATWYGTNGSRPRPRPHCVRRGPSSLRRERGTAAALFWAHVYCGHGRLSQLLLSSCIVLHSNWPFLHMCIFEWNLLFCDYVVLWWYFTCLLNINFLPIEVHRNCELHAIIAVIGQL